ncbi:DNA-binding protein, histone-like, putative [Pustulibacterium marinum]|uniref:DNA-binding protein, histone-like, putative n=1 Tax=Pustulibacterium marinum TaxID=1224947 RepID=A0A1I7IBP8_9FLAO|nr:HU family DNA-binding protein [Pustulibacterium marinum]SFU70210.1 DNA-binding protein, histone-like, putative [Pustulibacterium marinum]
MAVHYRVHPRPNPQDREAPAKYYATAVLQGETNLDTLANAISHQCSLTRSDCYAVLVALEDNLMEELQAGRSVKLGRIGSFRVSLTSEGMPTATEVNPTKFKQQKIIFKPAKALQSMLKKLRYKKLK